jgi:hypothetical protein
MAKLGQRTIELLLPIAERIDAELAKPQSERKPITILSDNPGTLKSNLTLYKYSIRRDWNGLFWMNKKSDGIVISFQSRSALTFTIAEDQEGPDGSSYRIKTPLESGQRGPLLDMNDDRIVQYLLEENPPEQFFLFSALSEATRLYFSDPANEDPTALVTFLHRRGYKYQLFPPNTIKLYT